MTNTNPKAPMQWLEEDRGLDADLLEHLGVRAVSHPDLGDAVAFQYKRNGKVYAAKFRTVAKRWSSTRGVSRGVYNEDSLSNYHDQPVVITEGEIDAASCIQAGFLRTVSVPDGWTEGDGKRDAIIDIEDRLRAAGKVIVAGDNDEAGQGLAPFIGNLLDGCDVRYVEWPDGCKDANDVLVRHGEDRLRACIEAAKQIDPEGGFITSFSDLPPMSRRRVLKAGIRIVDQRVALEQGAMSVLTGTPGSGKSTFATFLAYHVAHHENVRVGIFGFETHPYTTRKHVFKLHAKCEIDQANDEDRKVALAWMDEHFRLVHRHFDKTAHHLPWLQSMIKTLAVRDNCKLIIIDPWNELEHLPEQGESMTSYINFALQQIRVWAQQYDTHIMVVAHPKKLQPNENGITRAPGGYDVADSAAFFNKPALGITVNREQDEEGEEYVSLNTWKSREVLLYEVDRGSSQLAYWPHTMSYTARQDNQRFNRSSREVA
jgi:twinkle protein